MSYEGYTQYICGGAHLWQEDDTGHNYGDEKLCPVCRREPLWSADVDLTNGERPELLYTMPAPVRELAPEDQWKVDHYGNRYAVRIKRYLPDHSTKRWRHPPEWVGPSTEQLPPVVEPPPVAGYKYRNFTSNAVPEDQLWLVCGRDNQNHSVGVLEWCVSEEDAKAVKHAMSEYPYFEHLHVSKWSQES